MGMRAMPTDRALTIRQRLAVRRTGLTCRQVGRLLQSHLDGELDDLRARRVAAHLDDCLRCGLEAEAYRALRSALRRRLPVDPDQLARLREFAAHLAAGHHETTASRADREAGRRPELGTSQTPPP
jgi:anti-sigma factor RsiW